MPKNRYSKISPLPKEDGPTFKEKLKKTIQNKSATQLQIIAQFKSKQPSMLIDREGNDDPNNHFIDHSLIHCIDLPHIEYSIRGFPGG